MYDLKTGSDEGREWIEIYNDGTESIDISKLKFFESDTNHKLKLIEGSGEIEPFGYAVVVDDPVKFETDWPNFVGTTFDSSFSLSNDGEVLALKDGDVKLDEYFYKSTLGARGDGKSQQKIAGTWRAEVPTPGAENKISYMALPVAKKVSTPKVTTPPTAPLLIQGGDGGSIPTSETIVEEKDNKKFSIFPAILFVLLLVLGGGAVFLVRRRGITPKIGEDFEILS